MRKMLAFQITALLIISGGLGGMLLTTTIYDDVQSRIVLVLCLSCIKLQPKTISEFTFDTVENQPHPDFVLENLTKGPVFLHYSEDVCAGCEIMLPVVQDLFDDSFSKPDMFWKTVAFENGNVTHIYINLDHTIPELEDSFPIFDKDDIGGLPMFTFVTLGYDHGIVRPIYTTLYGTLNVDTDQQRFTQLEEILQESITMYNQNINGYEHH